MPLGPLRRQMVDCFDLNELRTLCLDMGIRYDDLSGDTISTKTASLVAIMQRRGQLAKLTAVLQHERPHITWFVPAQLEQQYGLRRNVRAAWIDGVLKQSVTAEIALELKLTYQPQALVRKTLYVPGQVDRPVEKDVPTLFAESGSLLILGEPGSGKTLTLLQLAESLLDVAEADPAQPTPVVLNLSSWAMHKGALPDWIVEELLLQYQLPRETSRRLIASGGLIYLLDGLDEVAAEARDACVQAINELKAQQPAPLVVCCRVAEYEGLAAKLNLGTAVCIQPLSAEQIDDYLRRPELKLTAVRQLVRTDAAMRELAQTPLFLSVMTLAYRDMKRADLKQLPTPEVRRAHLYDHYVAEMWRRRPLDDTEGYTETQVMARLTNLAYGMTQHEQTTFYIERLQPTWLPSYRIRHYAWINGILWGLVFGLVLELAGTHAYGLIIGLTTGLLFGRSAIKNPIRLYERLIWYRLPTKQLLHVFKGGLIAGLLIGLIVGLVSGLLIVQAAGLVVGLRLGLVFGLVSGLVLTPPFWLWYWLESSIYGRNMDRPLQPNQGIRSSGSNAIRMAPVSGLVIGLLALLLDTMASGLFAMLLDTLTSGPLDGMVEILVSGLVFGLVAGLSVFGGETVIRHYVLRWLLARQGVLPFPFKDRALIAYLDAMADRILLRRVGGGWVFIHRTLLDYFAALHPDATPAPPAILNPAGVKNPHDAE